MPEILDLFYSSPDLIINNIGLPLMSPSISKCGSSASFSIASVFSSSSVAVTIFFLGHTEAICHVPLYEKHPSPVFFGRSSETLSVGIGGC